MKIISERVTVSRKFTNDVEKDGQTNTYYNLTVVGIGFTNTCGVPKEVYEAVTEGDDIRLQGSAGFKRDGSRFWYFDDLYLGK